MSDNKIVVVTGGNNGIGLETCGLFAEQAGTHVIMASRSLEKGKAALATVQARAPKGSIEVVQLDITSDESIAEAVRQLTAAHGRVDTLINNAGICPVDTDRALFASALDTNAVSPSLTTRAFLPLLRKSSSPRVVYVSSKLGSIGECRDTGDQASARNYRVYRTSKAALNMVAACDARDYSDDGVKVFVYCPGFVVSDLAGMRGEKEKMGVPGPQKSAAGLLEIHRGSQDANADKFLSSTSIIDGTREWKW